MLIVEIKLCTLTLNVGFGSLGGCGGVQVLLTFGG
jgi:hypothetical protein